MESNVKGLLIFTVGAVLGGTLTYARLKDSFEKRLMEQDQKSNEFWKKYYSEHKVVQPVEKPEEAKADIREDKIPPSIVTVPESKQKEVFQAPNTNAVDYTKYSNSPTNTSKTDIPTPIVREPYPITQTMWSEKVSQDYETKYIHHYDVDDVWTDDSDEVLLGDDAKIPDYLGRVPLGWVDPGVYLVCNEQHRMVIQVKQYNTSYKEYSSEE